MLGLFAGSLPKPKAAIAAMVLLHCLEFRLFYQQLGNFFERKIDPGMNQDI